MVCLCCDYVAAVQIVMEPLTSEKDAEALFLNLCIISFHRGDSS